MADQPFVPPIVSPALDRWADFPQNRVRVGIKLSRSIETRVPTIRQAEDQLLEQNIGSTDDEVRTDG